MNRVLIIFVTAAGIAGCCDLRRSYQAPTAGRLVQSLNQPTLSVQTIRARAKVDQMTAKGRIKVKVFILATQDGKLRFEAVSPLDTTLVTLTSDGQRFASMDHKHNRFYSGPAKPCNIARVFGLSLPPRQVARALTGGTPVIDHHSAKLRWDKCHGTEVLKLQGKDGMTQRIWMRHRRTGKFQVLRSEIRNAKGKLVAKLVFERFRKVGGQLLPRVIKFEQPARKADVIIRYAKQEINVSIPQDAFRLTAPAGIAEQVLDCQ